MQVRHSGPAHVRHHCTNLVAKWPGTQDLCTTLDDEQCLPFHHIVKEVLRQWTPQSSHTEGRNIGMINNACSFRHTDGKVLENEEYLQFVPYTPESFTSNASQLQELWQKRSHYEENVTFGSVIQWWCSRHNLANDPNPLWWIGSHAWESIFLLTHPTQTVLQFYYKIKIII
jgi:hypothetical protein